MPKLTHHSQLDDAGFLDQFTAGTFPPSLFSHEAHLRLAYLLVKQHGPEVAAEMLCQQIKAFATAAGAPDKFNTTVTVASAKAMAHFIGKAKGNTFAALIEEFPRLYRNFKGVLGSHYGWDVFNDPKAKAEFVAPDLLVFPD